MDIEFHQLDLRYERLRVQSRDRQKRLLASIAERGQLVPIVVVVPTGAPEHHVVIDGYKRVAVLRRLGRDTVQAVRWEMEELDALVLGRSLRAAGAETALEEAWFLEELSRRFDLGLDALARQFDRSVSWVSRRLALVRELPESVQERVRIGEIVPHAAMKYLVPLARANRSHCERLATSISRQEMSSREVGELYAGWRDACGAARERILEDPALFLRTRQALAADQPAGVGRPAGESLIRDVHLLSAIARRIRRRWCEGAARSLSAPEREALVGGVRMAATEIRRLVDSFPHIEETNDARPRSPDGDPRTL